MTEKRARKLAARRHDIGVQYRFARRNGATPNEALRYARRYVAAEIVGHFRTWRHPSCPVLAQHWCDRDNRLSS